MAWWNLFKEAIQAALQEYGAGVVLLILAIFYFQLKLQQSWKSRLDDKDKEITRCARAKERLEKIVLKSRLSSVNDEEEV